jgi:HAD superfamily hydrolase (TIGR01458 family)
MAWIRGLRGALVDVDGTLLHGERPIPGAAAVLDRLSGAGIAWRLITNTTRRSRAEVAGALAAAGVEVAPASILAPAALARRRIVESGRRRAALLVPPSALCDFEGVTADERAPDWIVLGDLGRAFDWERLNHAFRCLLDGARLLALHRNRYWSAGEEGLCLDAGAFVAALEYAAGVTAEVVGKPARAFFELALGELGLPAADVLVVGDDVINEGRGAHEVGCRTAIVRTGKFREADLDRFRPDLLLDSIADLDPA